MSKPMTVSKPAFCAVLAMPTMPPAGPDTMESLPRKLAASARPPLDCMNSSGTSCSSRATSVTYRLQDGRQVSIRHGGVAPGDQLHQRAGAMRLRHLGEADGAGDGADRGFVRRIAVAVHADHGGGPESVLVRFSELFRYGVLIKRYEDLAVGADPLSGLDDPLVEHLGEQDPAVEDPRPVLVGDAQRVGEALGDDQDGGLALPLEQGVGGHRGAEPDRGDPRGGDFLARCYAEQLPDARHRGVTVGARVVREQLAGHQPPVGAPGDDVGERAAPVDPEFPASVHGPTVRPRDQRLST